MDILLLVCLSFLEMTFIFVILLIFHGLKKIIGSEAFFVSFGLLFVITELVCASKLSVFTGLDGLNFFIGSSVLLLPMLTMFLVIYVADGTLAAQRLIVGMMAGLGMFVYISSVTGMQTNWLQHPLAKMEGTDSLFILSGLLNESLQSMAATVVSFSADIFLLPIIFQKLRNTKCRMVFCVLGALLLTQFADSVLYSAIFFWGKPKWWMEISYSYLAKVLLTLWLSIIASYYLSKFKLEKKSASRKSFDIVLAFFGNYVRARELEHNLQETEDRYRLLFQSAGDAILSMTPDGIISDVNKTGMFMFGAFSRSDLIGKKFADVAGIDPAVWESIREIRDPDPGQPEVVRCISMIPASSVQAEFSISPIVVSDDPMLMVFGRDITEKMKLEQEREEFQLQSFHRQRLESIGRLAGGIAHDFNNYLHAIQGHLDLIKYMYPVEDANVNKHLDSVDGIASKAAVLTKQLLGFARKGNYQESKLLLAPFLKSSVELFLPNSQDFTITIAPEEPNTARLEINGDAVQLQQAFLNILFNARDAMLEANSPEKTIRLSVIRSLDPKDMTPPPDASFQKDMTYCAIRVADTGPGVDPAIRSRIFEPFFTTKPVGKGTGMGLSMAYGILISHKGWIQLEDHDGPGAVFLLVLPVLQKQ